MTKGIFFESESGQLHKCLFTGMDKEGKPMWMITTQGEEVMMLSVYQNYLYDGEEMRLLCLEDEKVESQTMALLLGAVMKSYSPRIPELLSECLDRLEGWGVSWNHDFLNFEVRVLEYAEPAKNRNCYRFYIEGKGMGYVTDMDNSDTLEDLFDRVYEYFDALELEAGIPVASKVLVTADDVLARISDKDKEYFDEK